MIESQININIISYKLQCFHFQEGNVLEALNLYTQYDVPAFPQNFNIYRRIALDVFSKRDMDKVESFDTWAKLRDMFFKLVKSTFTA